MDLSGSDDRLIACSCQVDANKTPAEVWSAIEKVVGKAPGATAAKPAAAAMPAAAKPAAAKVNEAFVFIKPHANNKAVQDLVRSKFGEKGIEIVSEGEINGATIDSNGFIDQHYYSIASKAMPSTPAEPGLPLMTSDDLLYQATPSTPAEP